MRPFRHQISLTHDRAHIIERDGRIVHGPHFGLSVRDRVYPVRLALTPGTKLDGRRIDEFFRPEFFATEFWLLWTTIMGPLPQHSAMEMRRYMNRFCTCCRTCLSCRASYAPAST